MFVPLAHRGDMARTLTVSRSVAARLSLTAHRQLARPQGHPHLAAYQCPVCLHPGVPADDETSVIVWSSSPVDLVRLAHGECVRSMVIETGRGAGYRAEPTIPVNLIGLIGPIGPVSAIGPIGTAGLTSTAGLTGPADLLTVDAFGVVHGGQPVILAGPTQEGALLTTKTLDHQVTVLVAARQELGFGPLDHRHTAPPGSPSRLAFRDDVLVVRAPPGGGHPTAEVLTGRLRTSREWTGPGTSADLLLGYFEIDALDDPMAAVAAAFSRGPVIGGHCRMDPQ
jgi:hypothetical protein